MKKVVAVFTSLAALVLTSSLRADPVVSIVTSTADDGPGTLRNAIARAGTDDIDEIHIAVTGTIVLTSGELFIDRDLVIAGPGPGSLAIQRSTAAGTPDFRLFHVISGHVLLTGMTVSNGRDGSGGGIQNAGLLTLSNVVVTGNMATNMAGATGGGVYNSGTLTVTHSIISSNRAEGGSADSFGGGIYNSHIVTVSQSVISANRAESEGSGAFGGGVYTSDRLTILQSTVTANRAEGGDPGGFGGGFYNSGTLTVSNSTASANMAAGGLGLQAAANADGGGIYNEDGGTVYLFLSKLSQNSAAGGDGQANDGGDARGGGLFNAAATTYLDRSTVSGNSATGGSSSGGNGGMAAGGGIANDFGTVFALNSTLSSNSTSGGSCAGGGSGGLSQGGALFNEFASSYFTNSTISRNLVTGGSAANAGENHGGGIANASGYVSLTDATIVSNLVAVLAVDDGGGFYNLDGSLEIKSTLLAANTARCDLFSSQPAFVGSFGFNLIGTTNGVVVAGASDHYNVNAAELKLGPLQDNGGPTYTHALLCGSLAIDAGDNADALASDQRGFPRIVNGAVDVGAFEAGPGDTLAALTVTMACPPNPVAPGGLIVFSGTVSNAGDVALIGIVIVNDYPVSQTPVTNFAVLDVGQSMSFTGSYTVPSDYTNCAITDRLIAIGTNSCTDTAVGATNSSTCAVLHTLSLACAPGLVVPCFGDVPPPDSGSVTVMSTAGGAPVVLVRQEFQTNGCVITITRLYGAADQCGNSNSCTQIIQVVDTLPPIITCALDRTLEWLTGSVPVFGNPTATDTCDTNLTITFTDSQLPATCPAVRIFRRTWTATDDCTNSASCAQTITYVDSTPPIITCALDQTLEWLTGSVPVFGNPTATDTCDTNLTITFTDSQLPATCPAVRIFRRTWTATDDCTNSASCAQTITYVDSTPPIITCASDRTLEWVTGSVPVFGNPTATDTCDTNLTITFTDSQLPATCPAVRIFRRTWTATDDCTNSASCAQTITFVDSTPPIITCALDQTLEWLTGSVPVFGNPTATDTCDTNLTITFTDSQLPATCPAVRIFRRTWTATDDCTNSASCAQTITYVDSTPPIITCASDRTLEWVTGSVPVFGNPTATDTCDTNLTITFTDSQLPATCPAVRIYRRTWTATDDCTNSASCAQTITFVDSTPPIITCASDRTLEWVTGSVPVFGNPTATDACDTNLTITFTDSQPPATCPAVRIFRRTWTATDDCTNSASCAQTITFVDSTPPIITCALGQTLEWLTGSVPVFGNPTATDTCDTNLTITFTDSQLPATCPAVRIFRRTWTATDDCTNSASCAQTITYVDSTPPIITCALDQTLEWLTGSVPVFGNPTATDTCDTNLTITFTDSQLPATCPAVRIFRRTWTATDDCTNSASCAQTITYVDSTPPIITCASDRTLEWVTGSVPVFGNPTATDTCDTNLTITFTDSQLPATCPAVRIFRRTWTATDDCTNSASCAQTITFVDSTPPIITCALDQTLEWVTGSVPVFGNPTATDTCDTNLTITFTDSQLPATCPAVRIYRRTWTATDDCTNSASCAQTITFVDSTPPIITCALDQTLEWLTGSVPVFGNPTATDACDTNLTITFTDSQPPATCPAVRIFRRTWTATDDCTNSASCSQTITYVDTAPPTVIGVPPNTNIPCFAAIPAPANVTAIDSCDLTPTITLSSMTNGSCPTVVTRTWIARDVCGNFTTNRQIITVVPDQPVVVLPPASQTVCQGGNATFCITVSNACTLAYAWYRNGVIIPGAVGSCYTVTNARIGDVGEYCVRATGNCGMVSNCAQLRLSAALGDFVWEDLNHNGAQEPNEPGVSNVTVQLLDCSSNLVASTITGSNGQYLFTCLPPGGYRVRVIAPGYGFTIPNATNNTIDCLVSGAGVPAGVTDCLLLMDGEQNLCVDIGLIRMAGIGNFVWEDLNRNGRQDAGEPGVPNIEVKLYNCSSQLIASMVTDGSGQCFLGDLMPSTYIVRFVPPGGYQFTTLNAAGVPADRDSDAEPGTGNSTCIPLLSGVTNLTVDAGLIRPCVTNYVPMGPCVPPYPFASANPRTSLSFVESEVLRGFTVSVTNGNMPRQIRVYYNDEHALVLGVRRVIVKTSAGTTTTDYPITALNAVPGAALNPLVGSTALTGDQAGTDVSDRPLYPALFITDITSDPTSLAGDWQYGGTAIPPHAVFGTWKGAVRTVDKTKNPAVATVTPDADPAKNNWNVGAGDVPPAGLINQGFGAEVRWETEQLGLLAGHTYRLYFMVHDGDQNKQGGDSGQGCVSLNVGGQVDCGNTGLGAIGDLVWQDSNGNGLQEAGEPGVPNVTVHLTDCAGMTLRTTTTDGSGRYLFGGLAPGSYRVGFMAPAGLNFTTANAGSDDSKDSDAEPATGMTGCFVLGSGQTNLTVDAGLVPGCRPSVVVSVECQDAAGLGQPVTFTGWVANTGDSRLTNVVLNHSVGGLVKNFGTLAPGVTTNFTGSYTPAGCGDITSSVFLTGRDACTGNLLIVPESFMCSVPCIECPGCVDPQLGLGAAAGSTVLQLGAGKVEITGPAGGIQGDLCLAGGKLSMSGQQYITGRVRLGTGAVFKHGAAYWTTVLSNVDLSAQISAANAAASNAAALPCTQTYNTLDGRSVTTIAGVVGLNVICVEDIKLSGRQLTLTGPPGARFIFNVSGRFVLTGGGGGPQIRVAGGVQPKDVLYNILGTGPDVAFSGGGGGVNCCNAIVDGTILAPQRKIALSPGLVNGQIISGKDISIVSGSSVRCPPCSAVAPAPAVPESRPSGLSAVVFPGQIALAWNDLAGATSYQVWRSTNSGGGLDGYLPLQGGLTSPACIDNNVIDGVAYFYVVTAILNDIETGFSGELIVGLPPPQIVKLEILSPTSRRLSIAGRLNYDYVIEGSDDLVTWRVIATVPNTDGAIQFIDLGSAASAFYRVGILP